jgi:RNase P/RNase MRP subunit POP5
MLVSQVIKIKPILPSLKEKKRYILYEGKLSRNAIKQGIKDFIGEYGMAKAGIMFIKSKNNKGIIKTNVKWLEQVKTALSLMKTRVKPVKVSGTLKKLKLNL